MALPTTVTTFNGGNQGGNKPYISSGGNVYVLVGSSMGNLSAFKATDPTSSFAEQSGGPTTDVTVSDTVQDGDVIHVVTTNSVDNLIKYHSFNMSTDTWDTTDETVTDLSGMNAPAQIACSINIRGVTNDEVVVAYNGLQDNDMGTAYGRVDFSHKDKTGSTWTGPVSIDDGASDPAVNYKNPLLAPGTSNGTHVVYLSGGGTHGAKTIDSSNNLSTVDEASASADTLTTNRTSYDSSGTQKIRFCVQDTTGSILMLEEDGSNNAVYETTASVAAADATINSDTNAVIYDDVNNGDLHALFAIASDDDIYYDVSTDDGSTWTTDVEEYDAAEVVTAIYTNIYARGTDVILAYVFKTIDGIFYHEKDIGDFSAPEVTRRVFLIS